MKGWILTAPDVMDKLPFTKEEAAAIGFEILNVYEVDLLITNEFDGTIVVGGVKRNLPDFVLAAFVQQKGYKPMAVLRHFESLGIVCINRSAAIEMSKDKIRTSQVLAAHGLPIAKTLYSDKKSIDFDYIESEFTYPFIIKIVDGALGTGVFKANNRSEAENIIAELPPKTEILFQEYISTSFGRDIRVTSFCGKIIKVVGRESNGKDFRSNVSLGGHVVEVEENERMRELAEKIYKATNMSLCGIDLLYGTDDYIICELNSMPGNLTDQYGYTHMRDILSSTSVMVAKNPVPLWKKELTMRKSATAPLYKVMAGEGALNRYKMVSSLSTECQRVQKIVLDSIIENGRDTLFGKDHSFDKIEDLDSFRKYVPILSWSDIEPYSDRMVEGQKDILFKGETESFIVTSGTTAKPKMIPESILGKHAKGFVTAVKFAAMMSAMPSLARKGGVFPIVSASAPSQTESGISYVAASTMALEQVPKELDGRMAFPLEIMKAHSAELTSYLTMRYAIEREDMAALVGNNASRMVKLIEIGQKYQDMIIDDISGGTISIDIEERDRSLVDKLKSTLQPNPTRGAQLKALVDGGAEFIPANYWPNLKLASFWTSSSVGVSIAQLRPLIPTSVRFIDTGYGASELKINIPISLDVSDGLLSTSTAFYEFIEDGDEQQKPLLANELEAGKEYEIIVTTYAGLYRYNMHDIVKCTGFMGNTPMVVFTRKSGDISNIAGEKLPASALLEAIEKTAKECGIIPIRAQAIANVEDKCYHIFAECSDTPDSFATKLNENLIQIHYSYSNYSKLGLINPLKVTFMKRGWQDELYRQKKAGRDISESQIKLQVFIDEYPQTKWHEQ